MPTDLSDPKQRREFRKKLAEQGVEQVRYMVETGGFNPAKTVVAKLWLKDLETGDTFHDDIHDIIDDFDILKTKFVKGSSINPLFLRSEDDAKALGLIIQVRAVLDGRFGKNSAQSLQLSHTMQRESGGDGVSLSAINHAVELLKSFIKVAERQPKTAEPTPNVPLAPSKQYYVHPDRIAEIEALPRTKWDFGRLVQLCRELNEDTANGHHISTAALVRIIMDHVPPVLGHKNFGEVAANYGGGKSFKSAMQQLEGMRNISDTHIHRHIRQRDPLPNETQVDVKRELDLLLVEIISVASTP